MTNRSKSIKAITEGGIFTAAYALLAIISRYLLTGTDSLIYYFTPLVIAIYVIRNKISFSIAVLFASIALSFLFANPIVTLMVILPNIIIGFVFGCLEKYSKLKLMNYIITFGLCFIANIISIIAFEVIQGVDYWEDVVVIINNFAEYFPVLNSGLVESIIKIAIIATLLIDSVIKTVLLYLVISIIIIRLKLVENYTLKVKLPLKYTYIIAVIYMMIFIAFIIVLNIHINYETIVTESIVAVMLTTLFLYSLYLTYQFIIFIRFKFKNLKTIYLVLITVICTLLFPISTLIGLILNLINYNILLDMI